MLLRRSIGCAGLALFVALAALLAGPGCGSVHGLDADGAAGASGGSSGLGGTGASGGSSGLGGTGASGSSGGAGGTGGTGGLGGTGASGGSDAGVRDATADVDARFCTVKINEVQTGGTAALDEFIELYNTCPDNAFDLNGYALVYRSAAGTTDVPRVAFAGSVIAAGNPYFVCANTGFSGAADVRYTDGLAADGGGLALRAPDGHVLDSVGWGTATNAFVEGAAAPVPQPSQSIARAPDGHDTDDNANDFMVRAATSPGGPN
jgi:hypothetical protein